MVSVPLALLGVGHIHAPGYLRVLLQRGDVEVVGVYDVDPLRARAVAGDSGIVCAHTPDDCLKQARAVVVCSEPTRQLPLVQLAVDAGLPTLCEKPLGTTWSEAQALMELGNRLPVSVALPVRYHPAAIRLKRAVDDGALGQVAAVWATNRNCFPGGWFADPALAGGGCLLDHVVHVADLLRWIWKVEFDSVRAEAGNLHVPGLAMEDAALLLVECSGGMIASIDPSMNRPQGMAGALDLTMVAWGSRGTASVDIFAERFDVVASDGSFRYRSTGHNMDASMFDDWIDSVHREGPAPIPARDGFAATALALAAGNAATSHSTVRLAFPDSRNET